MLVCVRVRIRKRHTNARLYYNNAKRFIQFWWGTRVTFPKGSFLGLKVASNPMM